MLRSLTPSFGVLTRRDCCKDGTEARIIVQNFARFLAREKDASDNLFSFVASFRLSKEHCIQKPPIE
jgi:hypothetical protein